MSANKGTLRERLAAAVAAGEARYYDETPPDFADDDIKHGMIADAVLSVLRDLAEDEAVVERVARAMLADELNVYDRHEREKAWGHESEIWLSNARAAIAAIEEQKP